MRQQNQKLTPEEKNALKSRIFDQLGLSQTEADAVAASARSWPSGFRWAAAAAVLIAVSVPLFILLRKNTKDHSEPVFASTVIKTSAGESRRILLPDSSVVLLNAGSVLSWRNDFLSATGREVALEGNAFFSVRKRPQQKSFTVHTRSLAIAVLGTEFNVNARSSAMEVALVRGKVNVSQPGTGASGTILRPGEQIRLDTAKAELIRTPMNSGLYSAWTENKWNFSRTRLDEILSLVEKYYGVPAVFKNEQRKGMKITASITVGSLPDLVSVIENTLQIRIDLKNNQLLVQ